MKFVHLSDLHLGKRVNEFPMLEDQKYILTKIINVIDEEKPDGVIIAGDVYDKSVPSAEAVELFDDFLVRLSQRKVQVFVISGNHDSPERLAFGGRIMDAGGIHFSPVYNGKVEPIIMHDEYGGVNVFMLPFVKPAVVRRFFPEAQIDSYTDAVQTAINAMEITDSRNILISHQFVTGAERSESEEISVGGADNVNAEVFEGFDYVALGHIHGPQDIKLCKESGSEVCVKNRPWIRYCGTPLKYSFSEAKHKKSVTIIELKEKGNLNVRTAKLKPLHDMLEIRGTYDELMQKSFYEGNTYRNDYVHITLTDEDDIMDAVSRLRVVYHNLMKLDYDNTRTKHKIQISGADDVERKTPLELFAEFYQRQNGNSMSNEQTEFVSAIIEKIWEDDA